MLWSSAIWNTHISVLTATPSCQGSGPCVYRSTQHVFIIPALGYIIPIKISIWTYICAVRNVHSSMDIRRHHHLLPYPFYSSLWFTENTLLECTYLLMLFNQPGQENRPFLIQRSKPIQSALITHIPETLPCTWTALRTSSKLGHLMAPNPAPGSDSIISSSCYGLAAGQLFPGANSAPTGATRWISTQTHRWHSKGEVVQQW